MEKEKKINSQEVSDKNKTSGKKEKLKKRIRRGVLTTLMVGAAYGVGGYIGNKVKKDRAFEQQTEQKATGEVFVGSQSIDSIIKENNLEISPTLLHSLYQNEKNNKTPDLIGKGVSDISEGIRKIAPFMWTPNKSFGTRQIQQGAFLNFIKNMDGKEKIEFITKLGYFTINGEPIMKSCGFDDTEIGAFISYIEGGDYNTEDGNDVAGYGNGKLGFAMSILMLNKIYNDIDLNQATIQYQFKDNKASQYLLSERYRSGYVGAYRSTDYPRARVDAPKQLQQNIDIVLLWMDEKIPFDKINLSIDENGTGKHDIYLDMPDGDIGKRYKNNEEKMGNLGDKNTSETYNKKIERIIKGSKKLDTEQKRKLALLLVNSSFENLYFGIRFLGTDTNIDDKFINHKLDKNDIKNHFIGILSDEQLDALIEFCCDAMKICTNENIQSTIPVIQKEASHANNNINTIGRFTDAYFNAKGDLLIPIKKDTILLVPKGQIPQIENDDKGSKSGEIQNNDGGKNKEKSIEPESQQKYTIIRTINIRKHQLPRDIIYNQSQVMAYIITHNIKDINGNPIKKSTPASKIPQSVIAQFLSKDGKTPIKITPTYNPLNYLKAGEKIYILLPK